MDSIDQASRQFDSAYQTPEQSPGFLLWQVSNCWQRKQKAALSKLKLTHVQFVLLAGVGWLESKSEIITQDKLANQSKTDPMMTSQVVRTLEKKGLITRKINPNDKRKILLTTTDNGRVLLNNAIKVVEKTDKEFFKKIAGLENDFCSILNNLIR